MAEGLRGLRQQLTREEYKNYKVEERQAREHPVEWLRRRRTELQEKEKTTTNTFLKEKIQSRLLGIEDDLALEETIRQNDTEYREAETFDLREKALRHGPLFSQRLKWWLKDRKISMPNLWASIKKYISRNYLTIIRVIGFLGTIASWAFGLWFCFHFELGAHFLCGVVAGVLAIMMYTASLSDEEPHSVFAGISLIIFLAITNLMAYRWNFIVAPNSAFAGVIKNKNGAIIEVVDTSKFWMRTPRWRKGEMTEWRGVGQPGKDSEGHDTTTLLHSWKKSLGKPGVYLSVKATAVPKPSGFKELFEQNLDPLMMHEDIQKKVDAIIGDFIEHGSFLESNKLTSKIMVVENDLFALTDVSVEVKISN